MFRYKSIVTVRQQGVSQEDVELEGVWDICRHVTCGCRYGWLLVIRNWMSFQVNRIKQMYSRNRSQVERFASGQNMLVKDGCSNHDDSNSKLEKYRMVENEQTTRNQSETDERQRSRVRSRVKCLNGTEYFKNLDTSRNVTTWCAWSETPATPLFEKSWRFLNKLTETSLWVNSGPGEFSITAWILMLFSVRTRMCSNSAWLRSLCTKRTSVYFIFKNVMSLWRCFQSKCTSSFVLRSSSRCRRVMAWAWSQASLERHHRLEEHVRPRAKPIRETRTQRQRDIHELTHLLLVPWCPACVSGKTADEPH